MTWRSSTRKSLAVWLVLLSVIKNDEYFWLAHFCRSFVFGIINLERSRRRCCIDWQYLTLSPEVASFPKNEAESICASWTLQMISFEAHRSDCIWFWMVWLAVTSISLSNKSRYCKMLYSEIFQELCWLLREYILTTARSAHGHPSAQLESRILRDECLSIQPCKRC